MNQATITQPLLQLYGVECYQAQVNKLKFKIPRGIVVFQVLVQVSNPPGMIIYLAQAGMMCPPVAGTDTLQQSPNLLYTSVLWSCNRPRQEWCVLMGLVQI